jgi:hypothetical protein
MEAVGSGNWKPDCGAESESQNRKPEPRESPQRALDPTRAKGDRVSWAISTTPTLRIIALRTEPDVLFKPEILAHGERLDEGKDDPEPINLALRENQRQVDDWEFGRPAAVLHVWAERMVFEFKLDVGVPSLLIERLRRPRLGHFRYGRNGFGLKEEIAIDTRHLTRGRAHDILGTLLHELLHSWQQTHGRPSKGNYHNREFRVKALALGLIVDRHGHTDCARGETPFIALLWEHGIKIPEDADEEEQAELETSVTFDVPAAGTKLKLYECPCRVKVRVGRSRFNAQCLDCGGRFELKQKATVPPNEGRL